MIARILFTFAGLLQLFGFFSGVSLLRAQGGPVFVTPPVSASAVVGASAALSVEATASGSLSYQWYRGESGDVSAPVWGATGPLLVTPPLKATTRFWVRVSSVEAFADSPSAMIMVGETTFLVAGAVGSNNSGQLGIGSSSNRTNFAAISSDVVSVSAGGSHSLILKTDGSLWGYGSNIYGQLGGGSQQGLIATGVVTMAAGGAHTLYVKEDGSLWALGLNLSGQLGVTTPFSNASPVQVATGVVAVAAGSYHSLFIKADGTLWAMGANNYGQLGDGTTIARTTPVQVATGVKAVNASGVFTSLSPTSNPSHSLFVKADGSLWSMGANIYAFSSPAAGGQLTPVQVATGVAAASAGANFYMMIKVDGTLWAMGRNEAGQLGDGTLLPAISPVQIATDVASVSAGLYHTMYIKTDGSLWTTGVNSSGQLGDGTTTNRSTPVQVAAGVASVSAGPLHSLVTAAGAVVTFDLGERGARAGGGALVQPVFVNTSAVAPNLVVDTGWVFAGWEGDFDRVSTSRTISARYEAATTPVLHSVPVSSSVSWRGSAALEVTATANGPLTYQWYRGESGDTTSPVPGTTVAMLVTPPLASTARFWVRVSNSGLSIDSPSMLVTIRDEPVSAMVLRGMGGNYENQLGGNAIISGLIPAQIATDAVFACGGLTHTLYLKVDGSLWAIGGNSDGQLGHSFTFALPNPLVPNGVVSVAAGALHSMYVQADGTLWATGANASGQLGDGTKFNRSSPIQVAAGVASVAAGSYHTLFIKTDGSLWAMGSNAAGQLGDGTTITRILPVKIAEGVLAVAAGGAHSLFVKADGSLWAMGSNTAGQLGDGTNVDRASPVLIASDVAFVAAGNNHTLFAKDDGTLWSVGDNSSGQLGDGTQSNTSFPRLVAANVVGAAAGGSHSLFITTSGALWAMGNNGIGQLGYPGTNSRVRPVQIASGVYAASAGTNHSLFIGQPYVVTFDLGTQGTRTGGGALMQEVAVPAAPIAPTFTVASGWLFTGWDAPFDSINSTRTITARYEVATPPVFTVMPQPISVPWQGSGSLSAAATANGPLTYQWYRGEASDTTSPVAGANTPSLVTPPIFVSTRFWLRVSNAGVFTDSPAVNVSVHGRPSSPLAMFAVGANSFGQLGDGSTTNRVAPIQVDNDVIAVSGGAYHSLFIKSDHTLWAVGANTFGQLGDGSTTTRNTPVPVATDVVAISAGIYHSFFLKSDGSLWATGSNGRGQLGDGTTTDRFTPVQVASDVASVSAAYGHTLFVKTDGTLWAMGGNSYGELGIPNDGITNFRTSPALVASDVKAAAVGNLHSLFVRTDGTLWAMGNNSYGQLGDGTTIQRLSPVQVDNDVAAVSAGGYYSLFLKTNGLLWGTGINNEGQLGDGRGTNTSIPVQVAAGVAFITVKGGRSLFLKTEATLWAMGRNNFGQLGDGTTIGRLSPVLVAENVISASAGDAHTFFIQSISGAVPYSTWIVASGLSGSASSPFADPDGDGASNLIEYAFGTNPAGSDDVMANQPVVTHEIVEGSARLSFTHRRLKNAALNYTYQCSVDLSTWEVVPLTPIVSNPDVDGDGRTELVTVSLPLPAGGASRTFLRLSISQ